MALEEQIVAWSQSRPAWQQSIMRRLAEGGTPSPAEYDSLTEALVAGTVQTEASLALDYLGQTARGAATVLIASISTPQHVNALESAQPLTFGANGLTVVYKEASELTAKSFATEPLPGVGTSTWKVLWEAARKFSEEHAYPGQSFPVMTEGCRCVLCQQELDSNTTQRLGRFQAFVTETVQQRLRLAEANFAQEFVAFSSTTIVPEVLAANLRDLEATDPLVVEHATRFLAEASIAHREATGQLSAGHDVVPPTIDLTALTGVKEAETQVAIATRELENPQTINERIALIATQAAELELLESLRSSRPDILEEMARLRERARLEDVKTSAATGPITQKIAELSEEGITEVVRDTFTRESDRLRLERVTLARTRADKGLVLHQPKLVGARQQVALPRVFSEGERTALGLAAYFTEAVLDPSRSALVLDDPVTSLDHVRRALVASRLADLANTRQVVVFTHDVSFVGDLKREAGAKGVAITERSVMRSRADERKPGTCGTMHPWKAKDVPARFDELRRHLAQIKRDSGTWEEKSYEDAVATWAGNLSETWERIFSQEIVGTVLTEGGLEVRPMMVKVLTRFSEEDQRQFEGSYGRVSQWTKRHDKSALVNYVPPDSNALEAELAFVEAWFKRVKGYRN